MGHCDVIVGVESLGEYQTYRDIFKQIGINGKIELNNKIKEFYSYPDSVILNLKQFDVKEIHSGGSCYGDKESFEFKKEKDKIYIEFSYCR